MGDAGGLGLSTPEHGYNEAQSDNEKGRSSRCHHEPLLCVVEAVTKANGRAFSCRCERRPDGQPNSGNEKKGSQCHEGPEAHERSMPPTWPLMLAESESGSR